MKHPLVHPKPHVSFPKAVAQDRYAIDPDDYLLMKLWSRLPEFHGLKEIWILKFARPEVCWLWAKCTQAQVFVYYVVLFVLYQLPM